MGDTHTLSDEAIRLASALGTKSKRRSHLHGRNSLAVSSGHRAHVSTRHKASGRAICMGETHRLLDQAIGLTSEHGTKSKRESHLRGRNSLAVRSGHRARVSTRHQEQPGERSEWRKLTGCWIRPSDQCQHSAQEHLTSRLHGRNSQAVGFGQ